MPYIDQETRYNLDMYVSKISNYVGSWGELNYTITRLLLLEEPQNYDDFNCIIGVLDPFLSLDFEKLFNYRFS